jgi:diguanylate cyclase (GGDEF)-like protein
MRSNIRSSDVVGRWGGDEFILLVDGDLPGAHAQVERMQKWVFGEYTIQLGASKGKVKTRVEASIGIAEWQPGETSQQIIQRADSAMYKEKELAR